jgi:hypothetical protein
MIDIPPTDQLAQNIVRHVDGLAREVTRRMREHGIECEPAVRGVLLDWFLGNFIPQSDDTSSR